MSKRSRIDDLVAAERMRPPRAPRGAAKHGWHRLQRAIATGGPSSVGAPNPSAGVAAAGASTAAGSTVAKWIVIVVAASGVGGAIVAGGGNRQAPRRNEHIEGIVTDPNPKIASSSDREPKSSDRRSAAPIPPTAEERRGAPGLDAPGPAAGHPGEAGRAPQHPRTSGAKATRSSPRPPEPETAPGPADPAAVPPALDAELALIRTAQRELARGDTKDALVALERHEREFPSGAMVEDRVALRIIVLCRTADRDRASSDREDFLRRWPHSVHAGRVRSACDENK